MWHIQTWEDIEERRDRERIHISSPTQFCDTSKRDRKGAAATFIPTSDTDSFYKGESSETTM